MWKKKKDTLVWENTKLLPSVVISSFRMSKECIYTNEIHVAGVFKLK
jgi:hypothetical protein